MEVRGSQSFTMIHERYAINNLKYLIFKKILGKYAMSIAYKIHKANQELPAVRMNLRGLILGAPFLDPVSMIDFGEFMYNIGLIDENGKAHFDQKYADSKDLISKGKWIDVDNVRIFKTYVYTSN